jgi:cysteinyl-tRNA synthetase
MEQSLERVLALHAHTSNATVMVEDDLSSTAARLSRVERKATELGSQLRTVDSSLSSFQEEVVSAVDADLGASRAAAQLELRQELGGWRSEVQREWHDAMTALQTRMEEQLQSMGAEAEQRAAELLRVCDESATEQRDHAEAIHNLLTIIDSTVTQ